MATVTDCPRPRTGKEAREYNKTVKALGGERSTAGKAFIEGEHRKFKRALAEHKKNCSRWH